MTRPCGRMGALAAALVAAALARGGEANRSLLRGTSRLDALADTQDDPAPPIPPAPIALRALPPASVIFPSLLAKQSPPLVSVATPTLPNLADAPMQPPPAMTAATVPAPQFPGVVSLAAGGAVQVPATLAPLATPNPSAEIQMYQQLDAVDAAHGLVVEGHSNQVVEEMQAMNYLASDPRIKTVCETGFNGGHSSLRWLLHSQAKVYTFDIGQHPYSEPAATWLSGLFPGRIQATWGDSTKTVPVFHQQHPDVKCNLIFVDGGHDYSVAAADLMNFAQMADPEYHILLMDDVYCGAGFCAGPNTAWTQLISSGAAKEVAHQTIPGGVRGFAVAKYTLPLPR